MADKPTTVDEYFAALPSDQAKELKKVRKVIRAAIPGATERIAYGMPCVVLEGQPNLHFAAWKDHVGIYPVLAGSLPKTVATRAEKYRTSKGTLTFKYEDGIPYDLIGEIAGALSR